MKASHFNNLSGFWWHISWANVSFVGFVRVFVSWQGLYLTDPNMPSRYASVSIKGGAGIFSASVFQAAALYSVLQNPNRVSLSTPSWWLLLFPPPPFNYEDRNTGLDVSRAPFRRAQYILLWQFHALWGFSSCELINQVENTTSVRRRTKWAIFSTKKNFEVCGGSKEKSGAQSRGL